MPLGDKAKAWLSGPEAQAVFKAAWHEADRKNVEGSRVEAGLAAVAERLDEVL